MGICGESKVKQSQSVKQPTSSELKTFFMMGEQKLTLERVKIMENIKKRKKEIIINFKENNFHLAKAKMDSIIREENLINAYEILGPICNILANRGTYIISNRTCPEDIKSNLDTLIYASFQINVDEFQHFRECIEKLYGSSYVLSAKNNQDEMVNRNVIEKLRIRPATDAYLILKLKDLCKECKIEFEFPEQILNEQQFSMNNNDNNDQCNLFNPSAMNYNINQSQGFNPYGNMQDQGVLSQYNQPGGFNQYTQEQGGFNQYPQNQSGFNDYGRNNYDNQMNNNPSIDDQPVTSNPYYNPPHFKESDIMNNGNTNNSKVNEIGNNYIDK